MGRPADRSVIEESELFDELVVVFLDEFQCQFSVDTVGAIILDAVVVYEVNVFGEILLGFVTVVKQFRLHRRVVHWLRDQRRIVQQLQLFPLHRLVKSHRVLSF